MSRRRYSGVQGGPGGPRAPCWKETLMKQHRFASIVFTILLALHGCLLGSVAKGAEKVEGTEALRGTYEVLRKVELDTSRAAPIDNFVIQQDITKITLVSGKVWFTKPWREGARPTGACFLGEGRIQMTPPIKVEKD